MSPLQPPQMFPPPSPRCCPPPFPAVPTARGGAALSPLYFQRCPVCPLRGGEEVRGGGGGGAPHRGSPSHRGGSPAQEKLSNGGDFWERLHLRLLPHRRNAAPPGAQITRLFRGCLFRLSVSVPRGGGAGVSLHPPPAPRTVSFSTMAPGISGSGFIPQPSVFAAPLLDTGGGQNLRPPPPPGPAAPPPPQHGGRCRGAAPQFHPRGFHWVSFRARIGEGVPILRGHRDPKGSLMSGGGGSRPIPEGIPILRDTQGGGGGDPHP